MNRRNNMSALPIICRKCHCLLRDNRKPLIDKTAKRIIVRCADCGQTYHYDYDSKLWSWEVEHVVAGRSSNDRGALGKQDFPVAV